MLTKKFAVYVPSTVNVDKPLDKDQLRKAVDSVLADMSRIFGGATAWEAEGAWLSGETGQLIKERITIVYAYSAEDAAKKATSSVYEIARRLAAELRQEAVTVETPAGMDFVQPAAKTA